MTKYRLTIEKLDTRLEEKKSWEKLRDLTEEEKKENHPRKNEENPQYGYVVTESTEELEETILEQTKEGDIDILAIINAFNK